eukprot:1796877-Prymnesium_polylepis.1
MPPRRRSQNTEQVEPNRVVSSYLGHTRSIYFDMCKATNAELTCAICLENSVENNVYSLVTMDLGTFIDFKNPIFQKSFLYIIKQQATNNTNVHRCGLSGRQQFPNADLPYRADSAILKGMLGRAVLYKNYWAPIKGTIYAALRIKAAQ